MLVTLNYNRLAETIKYASMAYPKQGIPVSMVLPAFDMLITTFKGLLGDPAGPQPLFQRVISIVKDPEAFQDHVSDTGSIESEYRAALVN